MEELAEETRELSSDAARDRERSRQRLAAVDEQLDRASRQVDDAEPDDPVAAGLKTLHELRDEYESEPARERSDHELDAAREHVQRLQDSVRSLGDVVARYGQDVARPGEGTPLAAAATPTEPRSIREQHRQEADAKRTDATERHERTKRRMMRLGLVLVAATVISPLISSLSPAQPYAIATSSMEPSIQKGSLVISAPGEPEVGDVVVYESALGSHQVHRVKDVTERDGTTYYTTRGDANERADSFSVPAENVRGVVTQSAPYVGYLWLIPLELQLGIFVTMLVGYVAITFADDRVLAKRVTRRVAAIPLAAALLIPASSAMVQVGWPAADHTIGVADPSPIPLENGTVGTSTISPDNNSATATVPAPPIAVGDTWKETVMWGCWPHDSSDSGCHLQANSSTYATVNGSLTQVDVADYDPAPTVFLEAYLKAPAGEETRVRLFDNGTGSPVSGSAVSTTDTSLVRVRSSGFNLSGVSEYQFQTMTTNGTDGGEVRQVKLLTRQSDPNDTVTRVRVSGGSLRGGGGGWQTLDRSGHWRWDAAHFDGTVNVRFEVVANGKGDVALHDITNNKDRGQMTFNTQGDVVRKQATANLVADAVHDVQAKTGGQDDLRVHLARVVVEQRSLNTTGRYVDMTWPTNSTATSFTSVGYPGFFHGDGELGNGTGRFEATLENPSGGTVYADLYNATGGQAVAGSQVSTNDADPVRLRSGWIDMDAGNASYRSRVRTDSGSVRIQNAWALFNQTARTGNKTYDHVLETKNDGGCTFDFHLESVSATNTSRMANATVTLDNGTSSAMQIAIQDGSLTKTSGSPVGVAPGATVDHVVQSDPDETGRTEIEADLVGRCRDTGVQTIQHVTYVLE